VPEKRGPVRSCLLRIDKTIDGFCIVLLVTMILIVVMAVITRKGFGWMFAWSEEITLLCLTWFTFMGIAVGFRERLHLSMDLFGRLSPKVLWVSDRFIDGVTFFFGLYLVIFGWDFAMSMRGSILSATEMPNLVQYIVMPITGVMTCVYAALQFMGYDLRRYNVIEEEIKRDAE
jgi:TRAP-type C4-dicarboxylate transport system permease small subunit